ncbi:MAG: protein-L-isoaspartate(D-aspartate) O-methyltransferase [Planctomycetota bacterium]|jgi:protein-L-isoaspartate(D-aspartate) O-methyltransferase|nr:protein-L-isoaspartate(D-aspartate) O-methyltransferase [Planctomycetota bacterium]
MTVYDLEALSANPPFPVPRELAGKRRRMLERDLAGRDISDRAVLAAMAATPRHEFVPAASRGYAYDDGPLGIGSGQTVSQPYIVARMTQALELARGMRALEIGTGSGYQTAILAALGARVFTVERHADLSLVAGRTLARVGSADGVTLRVADGSLGWPEEAPFDRILVTAAGPDLPAALLAQLGENGVLVMPVGPLRGPQTLVKAVRTGEGIRRAELLDVAFVPLIGDQGHKRNA